MSVSYTHLDVYKRQIQTSLLVITTIRVPLDLFFYSKLLKDLRTLKEGADHEELPILG